MSLGMNLRKPLAGNSRDVCEPDPHHCPANVSQKSHQITPPSRVRSFRGTLAESLRDFIEALILQIPKNCRSSPEKRVIGFGERLIG